MSIEIRTGDCRQLLRAMPDASVQCVVTSPPYFGLRDYGVDGQIGLEATPDAFVAQMVDVFREVRRVLKDDGTLWLNLGDSYAANRGGTTPPAQTVAGGVNGQGGIAERRGQKDGYNASRDAKAHGLKHKDLIGIPWRVAFALQADGWWLRQDIVWSKPNPMPESVRDRCTKAHEYIFLMTKSERYYYDSKAIAEPVTESTVTRLSQPTLDKQAGSARVPGKTNGNMKAVGSRRPQRVRAEEIAREKGLTDEHIAAIRAAGVSDVGKAQVTQTGFGKNTDAVIRLAAEAKLVLGGYYREFLTDDDGTRNRRSVWSIATAPFSEAHFATFPPELPEICIKAGSKPGDTILDPFGGAGTTGLVADRLGRNAILCELNPEYAAIARRRIIGDAPLFAEVSA
jgi:DNA modification methylase